MARFLRQVKKYIGFHIEKGPFCALLPGISSSKSEPQRELHLPGSIGVVGMKEVGRGSVLCWEVVDSNVLSSLNELRGIADETVAGSDNFGIVAVEHIERFGHHFQFHVISGVEPPRQAQIGAGIIGAKEGIAARAGQAIVAVIAILVGIARHRGAYRPPTAHGCDA